MLQSFANLKIAYKLLVPLSFLVITIGAILWIAQKSMDKLRADTTKIIDVIAAQRVQALSIITNLNDAAIQEKMIVIDNEPHLDGFMDRFNQDMDAAFAAADKLIALAESPKRATLNERTKTDLIKYRNLANQSIALSEHHDKEAAIRLSMSKVLAARLIIAVEDEAISVRQSTDIERARTDSNELADKVTLHLYALAGVGLALSLGLLAAIVLFFVVRPLSAVIGSLQRLAAGDFAADVKVTGRKDEIGILELSLLTFKKNGLELLQSEHRFRQLFEAAPSAMVMINVAERIEMVNAQTERLFGYSRAELLGARVEMLLPVRFCGRSVFLAEPPSSGMRCDGSEIEVEIGVSSIKTTQRTVLLWSIVDISDRVRLEAQVRQSHKMEAIGRVTAGVAHDFNNLFQALGGSLEMLLDAVVDQPEAVGVGQVALRATRRGTELTGHLLSFSRQQFLKPESFAVDLLLSDLKPLISNLLSTDTNGPIELVMMPSLAGLAAFADRAQLEAALINLAANARDAMTSGGCLRISAYESEADISIVPPGRYTVISVADTGSGMDANALAQACEPFFSTKGPRRTGLGLSMVQGFARQSGGDAHITSVVGEGTTIDVWLPSTGVPVEVETRVQAAPRSVAGHILLVDDSSDNLVVCSAFLRAAGLKVTSKASGDLALAELAAGSRFSAIVTDYAMPDMNGLELLRLAREIDPSMAAMIITGYSEPTLLAQINDFIVLRKPFNRSELTETVRRLLAAKPVAVPPAAE